MLQATSLPCTPMLLTYVVGASGGDHARAEPGDGGLSGDQAGSAQGLGGDAASGTQHSPAAVDHLHRTRASTSISAPAAHPIAPSPVKLNRHVFCRVERSSTELFPSRVLFPPQDGSGQPQRRTSEYCSHWGLMKPPLLTGSSRPRGSKPGAWGGRKHAINLECSRGSGSH